MATATCHSALSSSLSHLSQVSSSSSSCHLRLPSSSPSSALPAVRLSSFSSPYPSTLKPTLKSAVSPLSSSSSPSSSVSVDPSSASSASEDSVVADVAALPEEGDTEGVKSDRKPSPLQKGGTLKGEGREGKDPSPTALGKSSLFAVAGDKFEDPRWKNGTWDISQFTKDGKVDWDGVIDAEVLRRKWLEENPVSSTNDEPVVFDTSIVPWWAWVRRFHLPEAEKLNGRAAMIGYAMGYLVDGATGVGLVDQTNGFFGKLLILISVVGVLVIRKTEDIQTIKGLAQEWTFYDKQWQATWKEGPPRGGEEEGKDK